MTAYERGNYLERRAADKLRHDGYTCWQTRGSKTPADIIAAKPGQLLLVQVKAGLATITHDEWNNLLATATRAGAIPIVADRLKRGVIRWRRITHAHQPNSRDWPAVDWHADQVAAAMARHPAGRNRP